MDIFSGKYTYDKVKFLPTEPLNGNFLLMAWETKNFIYNTGSIFYFIVIIIVKVKGYQLVNWIAVKYNNEKWARKIGLFTFSTNYN